MRFINTKKRVAVLVAFVVLVGSAVGAYAYFTASGTGTGNFTSGTVGTITITNTSVGPLYPQTNPASTTPVTVTVTNNGASSQYVGAISGTVANNGGCLGTWFTVAPIAAPGLLTPGAHTFSSTIIFNDNNGNQDACAGQTETINWVSASG